MNIVIPMAGAGIRFAKAGYRLPKPLIELFGTPMIKLVIDNLRPALPHRFIFVCQSAHSGLHSLRERLGTWAPDSVVLEVDGLTDGAARTVLAARHLIDTDTPLMVANSDQYVDCRMDDYLERINRDELDGLLMTMRADDPKWSFASLGSNGLVRCVAEKQVISNEATVGIYNFRRGRDFVAAADAMIAAGDRVNGEFYVAPVYNRMISRGQRVGVHNIGAVGAGMYGLGTPADLEAFLSLPIAKRAAGVAR